MEQAPIIRAWLEKLAENDPASAIRMQDDTLLKTPEIERTELEKNMRKQCYDALINGQHGNIQEHKTPGYKFDVVENS
eukprot:4628657-Heterocapsa_arctica.AAC.2